MPPICEATAFRDERWRRNRSGLGHPQQHHDTIALQQVEIEVVVVSGRHRVECEVEAVGILPEDFLPQTPGADVET